MTHYRTLGFSHIRQADAHSMLRVDFHRAVTTYPMSSSTTSSRKTLMLPFRNWEKLVEQWSPCRQWSRAKLKNLKCSSFVTSLLICRRFWRRSRRIKESEPSIDVLFYFVHFRRFQKILFIFCSFVSYFCFEIFARKFCMILGQIWIVQLLSLSEK